MTPDAFASAHPTLTALALASPWWVPTIRLWHGLSRTASLDDLPATPPADAPRVSVVLPARNEAAHISACIESIRQSTWPNLELIVVDDHSDDGTGDLARAAAAGDSRVRVIEAPDLPDGWFGKQWACQSGAQMATGDVLLFTDADTRHAPDLVTRAMAARVASRAGVLSVIGRQDMETIWEWAVQPAVFLLILLRYPGGRAMERARRAEDVVANGQCFLVAREAYEAVGGHAAVRAYVAEDLMMAQVLWYRGHRISMVLGIRQLRTRMYDGLGAMLKGWGKNLYAGGRRAVLGGRLGRAAYPILLPLMPVAMLLPFVVLGLWMVQGLTQPADAELVTARWGCWSVAAVTGALSAFALANRMNLSPARRAVLAPLGAAVLLWIAVTAVWRGQQVAWKGRRYTTA